MWLVLTARFALDEITGSLSLPICQEIWQKGRPSDESVRGIVAKEVLSLCPDYIGLFLVLTNCPAFPLVICANLIAQRSQCMENKGK